MARSRKLVFLHSSDELYGADRMLLEMVAAAATDTDVEVWLPTDLVHPTTPLCEELQARSPGVRVRHLDLPIMRRAYQNVRGLAALGAKSFRLLRQLRASNPDAVYCTTSAVFLAAPMARVARVPNVIGHIQEIWTRSDRYAIGLPARALHKALSISDAVTASLPAALRRRTIVVPNGTPDPGPTADLNGRDGELRFLVASRWNSWKGHRTLLRAWDLGGLSRAPRRSGWSTAQR